MHKRNGSKTVWLLVHVTAVLMALPTAAREVPSVLPDPDGKPAAMDKPVKVFILLGQSNMLGFGKVTPEDKNGTLTYAVKAKNKYPHLVDDQGNWTERQDVRYVQVMHRNDNMSTLRNEWLTVKGNIGPELQFGHIMGYSLDEPVLILKSCIGNRSLGWDLLPPGSKQFEFEGKIYAGYGESPLSWDKGTEPEPINWYAGKQYDDDIGNAKKVMANIGEYYPGATHCEVAGFVWWQGHKDQNPAHAGRYEQNLVHLIKTLRKDFDAPDAKFVLATIAFDGWDLKGPGRTVANAQLAVSGETGMYPEFTGNVRTVEARGFWRDKRVSPSGAGYHYNHNAETYMEVGDAMGRAMARMLNGETMTPQKDATDSVLRRARQSSAIAGNTIGKVQRWLHEVALKKIEPDTGLYHPDGNFNYQDAWADCYPFLVWAAWLTDLDALNGPVRGALHAEIKHCKEGFFRDPANTFGGSEYVKDGLIAVVEVTGKDEWFDRMKAIQDEIWAQPAIDTKYGRIPSTNIEVNGEQIQALARLYTMTGEIRYLKWAERLADYYLLAGDFVPTRLRDHGCEIIGGLGLLLGVESVHNPAKANAYLPHMKRMLDTVLEKGTNADGIMHDTLGPKGRLSDGWGYNYVAYLCYDMVAGEAVYRAHMEQVLRNLAKPAYRNHLWEGNSIDGFADSVEGGIYIMNRLPVPQGLAWADHEVAANIVYTDQKDHLWGTMKLQSNGVRTAIMHALMHTRGVIARPWQQGLALGASPMQDGVAVVIKADSDWSGKLVFDIPRHRLYLGFKHDWPRMNTLPEWYTVEPGKAYGVRIMDSGSEKTYMGEQLHEGLPIEVAAGQEKRLLIKP